MFSAPSLPRTALAAMLAALVAGSVLSIGCGPRRAVPTPRSAAASASPILVQGRECAREAPLPLLQVAVLVDGAGLAGSQLPGGAEVRPLIDRVAASGGVVAVAAVDSAGSPPLQLRVPAAPAPVAAQSNSIMRRLCQDALDGRIREWRSENAPKIDAFRAQLPSLLTGVPTDVADPFPSLRETGAVLAELAANRSQPYLIFVSDRERVSFGCKDNHGGPLPELFEYSDGARTWICLNGVFHDEALLPKLPNGKVDLTAAGYVQHSPDAVPLPAAARVFCVKASPAVGPIDERCDAKFSRFEDAVSRVLAEHDAAQTTP